MHQQSRENIEKIILENYVEYQYLFIEFQSKFLSGLYSRYQSVENGNLVLYYAKQTHQDILRKKDYDLNFNISYEKFWENHHEVNPKKISIIKIAKSTSLPKETARRKILELIKQNVLNKKNKNIGWLPNEQYKKKYNLFIDKEIHDVCTLITYICEKINLPISKTEVEKEIKERFSFYWFHYLEAQLEYLSLWSKKLDDIELGLIFLQVAHLFASKIKKKKKRLSHKDIYDDPSLIKEFISASISATSVSEVTGIPRATCVRKLKLLVKLKVVSQDKISKRFYIVFNKTTDSLISQKITGKVVKVFSNFFFISVRAINIKT
tara:strand:+ start:954 stop:1919 length:966 start_codon:yes stop_codon:yes gene_type:complete